jgi:anion-transporting  ArsA/GET3 family ATPase
VIEPCAGVRELLAARLVIVTGKGGVGKTTVAAALARLAVAAGKRVLAAEVGGREGVRSQLHAALGETGPIGLQPRRLEGPADGPGLSPGGSRGELWSALLTPEAGHRALLRDLLPLGFLADRALRIEPLRRFLQAAPAFAELGVLYRGLELLRQRGGNGGERGAPAFDLLLLDAPATGHTLAFADLPQLLLQAIPAGPIGRAAREGIGLLRDPSRTRAVITTLPEALPVTEALELRAGLLRAQVAVHGVVANLVPDDPFTVEEHRWLAGWLGGPQGASPILSGARTVRRLWRARAALERLEGEVGRVLRVRERSEPGQDLAAAVAQDLAAAPAGSSPSLEPCGGSAPA